MMAWVSRLKLILNSLILRELIKVTSVDVSTTESNSRATRDSDKKIFTCVRFYFLFGPHISYSESILSYKT